jgi:monothiol glutaredoxin
MENGLGIALEIDSAATGRVPLSARIRAQCRKVELMSETSSNAIKTLVDGSDVVAFINGVPSQPQCSLSASMVSILHRLNAPFTPVNLLSNPRIREGLSEAKPQLFVKGEFVGSSDFVKEMYASGALTRLMSEKGIAIRPV